MFALALMAALFIGQTYKFMQYNKASEVLIDVNTQLVSKVRILLSIHII